MAKKAYIGVSNVAHKVKKMYLGVGNVAKKVKKAYVGVAGVAKLFFSGGELVYYGTTTQLPVSSFFCGVSHVGNYALFLYNKAYAYDTSLTLSQTTGITNSSALTTTAGTHVGNYAVFAGGGSTSKCYYYTYAYSTSLVRSMPTHLSKSRIPAKTHVGNYAVFAGGLTDTDFNHSAVVDAYNTSLTLSNPTALSTSRRYLTGGHVGNYAVFAGGNYWTTNVSDHSVSTVDAYNTSLTRSTPTALPAARQSLTSTHVGNYVLFAAGDYNPGSGSSTQQSNVYAYNTSLTRSIPTALMRAQSPGATHIGDYALFGMSYYESGYNVVNLLHVYDTSLTRTIMDTPSGIAGTHVGDYALLASGNALQYNKASIVYAYTIN